MVEVIGRGVKTLLEEGVDARLAFASESATAATVEESSAPPRRSRIPLQRHALEDAEFAGVRFRRGFSIGFFLRAVDR